MKIKKLKLYTTQLREQQVFYSETLGFPLLETSSTNFTVRTGWSELTFETIKQCEPYHFCFLIPANQLEIAADWLSGKTDLIYSSDGDFSFRFESWNANAIYFYDRDGNVVEFIVRHDLKNISDKPFDISSVICLNEIGMPTENIQSTNSQLRELVGTEFWKGSFDVFGTNGTQEGLLLLPNYLVKRTWFPTEVQVRPVPFTAEIEYLSRLIKLEFPLV